MKTKSYRSDSYPTLTLLHKSTTHVASSPGKARLEVFSNTHPRRPYWIYFDCPEFSSICPVTGQPDFGTIRIEYQPRQWCLESKSLKLYLFSFRNYGAFHETAVNRILDDLVRICKPRQARVIGTFNPRGGIAITVTAEYR